MATEGPGARLRALRLIRGWSIQECAAATRLGASEIEGAERGDTTDERIEALARGLGLSAELLHEDRIGPARSGEFSVFLLHGAYQDFESSDLRVFERALGYARRLTVEGPARDPALTLRRSMVPVRPSGPAAKLAAQQGHRLAGHVRERLELGAQPVGDLRALCEDRLLVPVLVDEFVTELRAASVVDLDRASAAIILSSADPARERNPVLARVYLAHELAHVLFDPVAPGQVLLALDDSLVGRNEASGTSLAGLYESRAKGFAAEFLLPRSGLVAELGAAEGVGALHEAARSVERAQARFGTPWELTVNHLVNHGFIAPGLRQELVESWVRRVAGAETPLPGSGAPPLCLAEREARVHDPELAQASWASSARAARAVVDGWVRESDAHVRAGRPRAAADVLCERLDALLLAGELGFARAMVESIDADRLPSVALTGLMTVLASAPPALAATRDAFGDSVVQALRRTHGWTAERIEALRSRMG